MRTIKFRGKRLDGEWVYGGYAKSLKALAYEVKELDVIVESVVDHVVIPESVGQWTGLVDRHGKEIFEGDIIKNNSGELEKIVFAQGSFKCASIKYPNANLYLLDSYAGYIEIIGNVIDSPELVEV